MNDLGVYVLEDNLVFMFSTDLRVKTLNSKLTPSGGWSPIARLTVWTGFQLRVSVLEDKSDPLHRLNFRPHWSDVGGNELRALPTTCTSGHRDARLSSRTLFSRTSTPCERNSGTSRRCLNS